MFSTILQLRPIDIILVIGFAVYAVFIIASWAYLERERILNGRESVLGNVIDKADTLMKWFRKDNEDYDPSWMDYHKWKETRI